MTTTTTDYRYATDCYACNLLHALLTSHNVIFQALAESLGREPTYEEWQELLPPDELEAVQELVHTDQPRHA